MNTLYNILAVFLGSGIGGVLRWAVSRYCNGHYQFGTLLVNIAGCFLLGLLTRMAPGNEHTRLLLMTGLCGGFTTFSTFITENLMMMRSGQFLVSILYIALSLVLGITCAWLGFHITLK